MYDTALKSFLAYQGQIQQIPASNHKALVYEFCDKLNIDYDKLYNKSRKLEYVRYRALFCNWVSLGHVETARILNKNHTSIMHLRGTHKERLQYDNTYKRLFKELCT